MNEAQRSYIDDLYFNFYDFLVSYAGSSLDSDSLAEEAVQETFAIACAKPDDICASPNPRGWLVNTLKNVIRNMERRRAAAAKVVADCLNGRVDVFSAPLDQLDLKLLYGNVADTEEFKLMLAISQDGKSMIELAEERGITLDACKKRAQRARENLQRRIK